jgi:hypothetical protein|tara:strand:- start:25 stop:453 length:429 start_codon:yes stop_codon:yes gene_type:complete
MQTMSKVVKLPPVIGENEPPRVASAAPRSAPMAESERPARGMRMHPFSGGLMLLVDNICFGATALTGGALLPLVVVGAFSVTACGTFLAQKFLDKDSFGEALAKSFFAGVLTGIPTPIAGTIVGGAILGISGLDAMKGGRRD